MEVEDYLSLVIALAALFVSIRAWSTSKQQQQDAIWSTRYQAFRSLEVDGDIDAYLCIHEITPETLTQHALTKGTFQAYLKFSYALWSSAMLMKYKNNIAKAKGWNKKVEIARKYTWNTGSVSGRILRSEGFSKAWPLIKRFWDSGDDCVTAPLIEAAVLEGEETRKSNIQG